MAKKPIVLLYKLKQTLPNQALLHSRWGWYKNDLYYRREFLNALAEEKLPKIKAFELELSYNTRHDCDNIAPFAKFFVDTLRDLECITNDTQDIYRSLKLIPDKTLPKQSFQFKIIPV
jgi:hypothetical protein